jgi:hypothetical protein
VKGFHISNRERILMRMLNLGVTELEEEGVRFTSSDPGTTLERLRAGRGEMPQGRRSRKATGSAAEAIPAPAAEGNRDPAAFLKAQIKAEYEEELNKVTSRRKIRKEFHEGQEAPHEVPTMERETYRAHILAHSLFPNLYNRQMVMTEGGRS